MPTVIPASAPASDVAALVERVSTLQQTQRTEDVDGFLALFGPDPVWVNGAGRRLIGLDEIAEFTRGVLPGAMANGTVEYRVEHVRFVTPDVALTGVAQQYLDLAGHPLDPPALGSPSYVWQRTDGTWKIVIGQNTTFGSS